MIARFDIVIAGGGLIGATLAFALARMQPNLSIAIVEAVASNEDYQPSFDSRAIAIAQGSKQLLHHYGIWDAVKVNAEPIRKIHVSDRGHIGKSYLKAKQFSQPALGYVLEVRHLGKVLQQSLQEVTNVQWYCPDTIEQITNHADEVELSLTSGQQISSRLLLVADGGQSTTRQLLNIGNRLSDYGQSAIIANIGIEKNHKGMAYERFTEFGPIALLPLSEKRYSLVWCVPPEQVSQMLAWDDATFITQLQQAFGFRAGCFIKAGKRFSYPLALTVAQDITAHRVALVGNASHTLHPIAGQGFNLGMRDIAVLASMVEQFDADVGCFEALHFYQQHRREDLATVISMTDTLVRLFSNDNKFLAAGRTLGLLSMQLFECLKQPIAHQGMGMKGSQVR